MHRWLLGADLVTAALAPMLREVLAMGLTWRDLVSSAAVVTMMLAFMAFKLGTGLPLLSSAWAAGRIRARTRW